MSDRRNYSPSSREYNNTNNSNNNNNNTSDDDYSPRSSRDKFRRERSLDGGTYVDSYQPKTDEYGRYTRKKRHVRSPSPTEDRRHKYRRTSPGSSPPHNSYRNTYSRHSRDRGDGRDGRDTEGDHYIPNYERDGYTPGARYGRNNDQSQSHHHHHHQQHHHSSKQPQLQQQQSSPQRFNYNMMENINPPMVGGNWSTISRMPILDPQQLDYVVPFKQYCDYLRQTNPRSHLTDDEFQKRYDEYKEKVSVKQLALFFNNNKEKQWFMEKYHPQASKQRTLDMKQQRSNGYDRFMAALEKGDYDHIQNDTQDTADLDEVNSTDNSHAANTNTSNNNNGNDNEEEYENQLVIKTVPPTIPRQKIIEMCSKVDGFQYLALSEPSVTKKFHRIGWIHFSEDTDMQKAFDELNNQKIDDFVFHLAMNRKNHSASSGRTGRTAPEITNTKERLNVDLNQATQLAKVLDAELGKQGINDVIHYAHQLIDRQNIVDNTDTISNHSGNDSSGDENASASNDQKEDHKNKNLATKKELDLILAYLRHVHMYCYYCGLECDSMEELNRRCIDPHQRKLATNTESKQSVKNERMTQQWVKNLDQRIRMKINPHDDEDIVEMGGKSMKGEVSAFLAEHIQKEHDAKFKCKVGDCAKAFKGIEFVEKHITSKHGEEVQRVKDEVAFYNNYVCDPNHLVLPPNANSASSMVGMNGSGTSNTMNSAFGGSPSFMMKMAPTGISMQAATMGTPWDQIPRIGFGGNVGWPTPMAGRIGSRVGPKSDSHLPSSSTSDMSLDMPQDPRQVKSYVDLDAPTDGDANISFY